MSKKLISLLLVFIAAGLILPVISLADGIYQVQKGDPPVDTPVCYTGFVPCGKEVYIDGTMTDGKCVHDASQLQTVHCQFCHFLVMINGIIAYVLTNIVPYLAVLMLVIAGIMYYFGGGKPELLGKAKKFIAGVVIGLFLIYGAYMIVGTFLSVLGVTDITLQNWASNGVFTIECPINISK